MTFKQSPPGFRNVCGALVKEIQQRLSQSGFSTQGVDGLWGTNTDYALRQWQTSNGQASTGVIDDTSWPVLMRKPVPAIFERALPLTGAWEGTGYDLANGNFDGEGITWGVVGFTWGNGELQGMLKEILSQYPAIFAAAFGASAAQMQNILAQPRAAQMTWARSISTNKGETIAEPWATAFYQLGQAPEVQAIQNQHAQHYWDAGLAFAQNFGLKSEVALAQCFDVVVQCTVTDDIISQIKDQIAAMAGDETGVMRIIAYTVANNANPVYRSNVLARKIIFTNRQGTVNGDQYDIGSWGIG